MAVYYPKAICSLKVTLSDYGESISQPEPVLFQPVSCSVSINSYVEADTFEVVARFEDLPFDPRLIRSAFVTISIFDQKQLDLPLSQQKAMAQEKTIFAGFADSHNIKLDSVSRLINLSGRDFTSMFIDTKFDNANLSDAEGKRLRKIRLNRPLVAILEDLKSNVPGAGAIMIEDRTEGAVQNFQLASGGGYDLISGQKSQFGEYEYSQPNETYWDAIVSLCQSAGLICYIERDRLVLTSPRILYSGPGFFQKEGKDTIPMIFGKNIESIEFRKNLGRKKRFNLLLSSLSTRTSKTTNVSIPRDATPGWISRTKVQKGVQMVLSLGPQGEQIKKPAPSYKFQFINKTKEQLIALGEGIFEEFVRQQLEGRLRTRDLSVGLESGTEFDLTQIKTGQPVQIEIAQGDLQYISRKTEDGKNISDNDRKLYLRRHGYSESAAQLLIDSISKISGQIKPIFYLREAQIAMHSDGFQLDIGFVNFILLGEKGSAGLASG